MFSLNPSNPSKSKPDTCQRDRLTLRSVHLWVPHPLNSILFLLSEGNLFWLFDWLITICFTDSVTYNQVPSLLSYQLLWFFLFSLILSLSNFTIPKLLINWTFGTFYLLTRLLLFRWVGYWPGLLEQECFQTASFKILIQFIIICISNWCFQWRSFRRKSFTQCLLTNE